MLTDICVRLLFCHILHFYVFSVQGTVPPCCGVKCFLLSITFPCVPLLPFQFCQHFWRNTVNQPLNVFQLAFQLCPFHRIFHLAFFAGFGSGFQLFIFCQKVVYCDLVFFELTREVFHLRKPFFHQGEGFLFLLSGVERGNTVQRGFNGSCLFGKVDRLLEQPGGDMLLACLAVNLPTLQVGLFLHHIFRFNKQTVPKKLVKHIHGHRL